MLSLYIFSFLLPLERVREKRGEKGIDLEYVRRVLAVLAES